jgi:putative phosphoesterase
MLAVVLSDTHVRRGGTRRLPDAAYAALDRADVILHAGDVLIPELLDELRGFAPLHAVLGNNDAELFGVLPEQTVVDLDGLRLAMVHDSGPRAGRAGRMRRRFPEADVVVFGHSHQPCDERGIDGQLLFNPGSPIERRMAPTHTIGELEVRAGKLVRAAIVDV